MRNKKAWLRIAEAFIAIILIAGVLVYFYSKDTVTINRAADISNFENAVLDEIASNDNLRTLVLEENVTAIKDFLASRIPEGFSFDVRICQMDDICGLQYYKPEIYSNERIISAVLESYAPRKVKIFMWIEQ